MKRCVCYGLIILAGFFLQNNLFAASSLLETTPNILLIITFSFGFIRGPIDGMLIGMLSGLLLDMFFGTSIGLTALVYLLVGYGNGILGRIYHAEFINMPLALCLFSDMGYNLCVFLFRFLVRGKLNIPAYALQIILPELIYTALLTLLLYPLLLKADVLIGKWETRSAKKFV